MSFLSLTVENTMIKIDNKMSTKNLHDTYEILKNIKTIILDCNYNYFLLKKTYFLYFILVSVNLN